MGDAGDAGDAGDGPAPQIDSGMTGCLIDGQAYPSRALNPANLGECCNPRTSPTAWLPLLAPGISGSADGGPNDGVIADFNGDGYADIAIATSAPQAVFVYLGLPDGGGYVESFVYPAGGWPIGVTAGDMNRDGLADLVVVNSDSLAVLLSNGDGTFGMAKATQPPCGARNPRVADVNGDGLNDVVAIGCGVSVFTNMGNGVLSAPLELPMSGQQVGTMELGGAGAAPDLVTNGASLVVAINNGRGGFPTTATTALSGVLAFATGPFSGGPPQVAAETADSLTLVSVDPETGAGKVLSRASIDTPGQRLVAADLNGDGLPDVVGFSTTSLGVSISKGNGQFANAVDLVVPDRYQIGSGIQMIAAGDLNGDGAPDILVMIGNGPWIQYLNSCP